MDYNRLFCHLIDADHTMTILSIMIHGRSGRATLKFRVSTGRVISVINQQLNKEIRNYKGTMSLNCK